MTKFLCSGGSMLKYVLSVFFPINWWRMSIICSFMNQKIVNAELECQTINYQLLYFLYQDNIEQFCSFYLNQLLFLNRLSTSHCIVTDYVVCTRSCHIDNANRIVAHPYTLWGKYFHLIWKRVLCNVIIKQCINILNLARQ